VKSGIAQALLAALLFGASTPCAKALVGEMPPVLLAGLLYCGSGLGLSLWFGVRRIAGAPREAPLARADWPWLAAAVLVGGALGPALLMWGLAATPATSASLLLNLEGVLTALLAWFVFHENFDRRIALGMFAIVLGGVVLALAGTAFGKLNAVRTLAIVGACLCWAVDNNLTRRISGSDAVQVAAIKGVVAGAVNVALAWPGVAELPSPSLVLSTALVGLFGYGVSLVLFVRALRHLGTARTAAYFSVAPFAGALMAILFLGEPADARFWIAGGLMALGVWLHVTERHAHTHVHEAMTHDHPHRHDAHHQHEHDFPWDGEEPHTHPHVHPPMVHAHPHFPDLHHRHRH
jgi:drug/metabolite transporter (DMT)-like permease